MAKGKKSPSSSSSEGAAVPLVPAASSPKKPKSKSSSSSSSSSSRLLPLSALVVLAAALAAGKYANVDVLPHLPYSVASGVSKLTNTVTGKGFVVSNFNMPNKYETDLVSIKVRQLLATNKCADAAFQPQLLNDGKVVSVKQAMGDASLPASDKVFFMLNGQNEGLYVSWNGQFDCLAQVAELAAASLGADRDMMENGVRLYSQMGLAVRNVQDLAATKNIVHVLLDFQLWVWPGIEKGHKYVLENGVTLKTVGIRPKVFDVEYFLTDAEAQQIMALGIPSLDRSRVDGSNSSKVVSGSRTSHTAFLDDGAFTREFRHRSAVVARLPSPTYVERLQLVRYAAGEFYRQHLDTFHSRNFLPKGSTEYTFEDYKDWANWAAEKLRGLDQSTLPDEYREDGALFPNAEDDKVFPNALLDVFYRATNASNLFTALFDEEWAKWIRENIDKNAGLLMPVLLKEGNRRKYLPLIIKEWEKKLGRHELYYTLPKHPVSSVSHFFHWVRWAKERVSFLGNEVPAIARPSGELYPKFDVVFQEKLLGFILDDFSEKFLTRLTNVEWYKWMIENRGRNHVLFGVMEAFPTFAEVAIQTWEKRVGGVASLHYKLPKYVKHFHPQRYATLFLYLTNQTKVGGETVFPYSLDRFSDEKIERDGMDECSTGLAVPPIGLHASLFYVQTPEGDVDKMSRHGGCPPHEGIKWGSNSFMWDSDADEGADLWTTK